MLNLPPISITFFILNDFLFFYTFWSSCSLPHTHISCPSFFLGYITLCSHLSLSHWIEKWELQCCSANTLNSNGEYFVVSSYTTNINCEIVVRIQVDVFLWLGNYAKIFLNLTVFMSTFFQHLCYFTAFYLTDERHFDVAWMMVLNAERWRAMIQLKRRPVPSLLYTCDEI